MAIFHGNAIPSGTSKQETWSPSSNDWDYTYDGGGEWPAAGNPLGDDSVGGFIYTNGGDSGLYSLFTFDGDLEITFTLGLQGTANTLMFGLMEITEDDNRGTNDGNGLHGSGIKSWMWWDGNPGGGADAFYHGNTNTGSHTYSDGDSVKITRESGTIKFYDGASVEHTFSATSTNPVRFFLASGGGSGHNIDNILFTDKEGVQRDGFINEESRVGSGIGFGQSAAHAGCRFTATRTGTIASIKASFDSTPTPYSSHFELWSDNGTSPGSQIGGDSGTVTTGAGEKTYSFSTQPDVVKGESYWAVLVDESSNGSGELHIITSRILPGGGYGKHDTITSITQISSQSALIEVAIETTEEPEPDWNTLLLIHSDDSDSSTTFVDSSQYAKTVTVVADAQHDTAQKKFGASSAQLDGADDCLRIAGNIPEITGAGSFTIDCWFRLNGSGTNYQRIFNYGDSAGGSELVNVDFYRPSSTLRCHAASSGSSRNIFSQTTTSHGISDTTWHHIAYVRNQTSFKVYIDGNEKVSGTNSSSIGTGTGFAFGGYYNDGGSPTEYFHGHIDEMRISGVARWDANFLPPSSMYP